MRYIVYFIVSIAFIPLLLAGAMHAKTKRNRNRKPRVVIGFEPIINIKYWSQSIQEAGYDCETVVFHIYKINKADDFDQVHQSSGSIQILTSRLKVYINLLLERDVWVMSYNGGPLGFLPLINRLEPLILKLAGIKTVIWPYGSDAYVYANMRDTSALTAIQISYPQGARTQKEISANIAKWVRHADIILPGFMACEGFGRFDLVIPNFLVIDEESIQPRAQKTQASDTIKIAHSPNHRGVKGTEYIIQAVKELQTEGVNIELLLLENMQNDDVLKALQQEADILVEQLIIPGHGLSAIEGMASGLPVISNLENKEYTQYYRRYSYLDECPIVSASPETIKDTLKILADDASLRKNLGKSGRAYAEKYHSLQAGAFMFEKILQKTWHNSDIDLMNLYHPLLGEYPQSKPRIEHPLTKNKLPQ